MKYTIQQYLTTWIRSIRTSIMYSLGSTGRLIATSLGSIGVFLFMIFSIFPRYSVQMISANPVYIGTTFSSLVTLLLEDEGYIGLGLTLVYAILLGMMFTVLRGRTRSTETSSKEGILSIFAALTVGCVSCGAGLLGLIGIFGAFSVLPFSGLEFRVIGILLVFVYFAREGDPTTCTWATSPR